MPLDRIDGPTSQTFAEDLAAIARPEGAELLIRFAPDMNAPWVAWGQQPAAYRAAFGQVAAAMRDTLPSARMVWSPAAGTDYPFAAGRAAEGAIAEADTTGDGRLDSADDPYGPYAPDPTEVDWVGLSVFHDDTGGGPAVNTVPPDDELLTALTGGGRPDLDFYGRFAEEDAHPMLIETAAFFSPSAAGPSELEIKQAWWRQVLEAVDSGDLDRLAAVVWRDTTTTRGVVGESVIDWSISLDPAIRAAFLADAADSELTWGPVRAPSESDGDAPSAREGAVALGGVLGWLVVALVLAAVVALFVIAVLRRGRSGLAYTGPPNRDQRIDLLRGVAIVFVVVNHIGLVSLFQDVTQEAVGVVSGAELFVLLSGAVLGLVYRPKLVSGGIGEVVLRTAGRSRKLYVTALVVVLLVFFVTRLPFVDGTTVTTFTDQGTGAAGSGATGRVYDLYSGADRLLQYPVDPQAVIDVLLLRVGPWQFNVMGLYVVLLLISPLVLWALSRRWWAPVLAVSIGLYVVGMLTRQRLLPSQFEDSFPLLVWQLLFVVGLTAGFHRREILEWFRSRAGLVVLGVVVIAATLFMLFSWNNPYTVSPLDARLALMPDNVFRTLYEQGFLRTYLAPGRLLNVLVLVVALYALLSAYWRPVNAVVGWFFIPLGQATLYVFVMHVFFALIAANVPVLASGGVWIDTLANAVILALLWVMVRTRFLFRIVPR
ncbi:OpgC domain-containing protein [Cnuibacter physcomitrellae]|uniref:OpgC family protein n=1 Tax=Cnuibacter physcomitrellae TaxID=1619308 RepID=UPI002175D83B|nr:OpgC domain-containing protein [Cnuibacter physcomitrellae]MCS5497103.1 OpgC domain-containing protein [Cnuibacter physcomitrellae]